MRKISIVLLVLFLLLTGCPASQNGTTQGPTIVQSVETSKTVAEDTLYYARVYYNLGKINESQFKSVKDAYDTLYVVQNQMIDARIAYLKMPTDATLDQKYRMLMGQVMIATQKLFVLASQLGIVKGTIPEIPIRK